MHRVDSRLAWRCPWGLIAGTVVLRITYCSGEVISPGPSAMTLTIAGANRFTQLRSHLNSASFVVGITHYLMSRRCLKRLLWLATLSKLGGRCNWQMALTLPHLGEDEGDLREVLDTGTVRARPPKFCSTRHNTAKLNVTTGIAALRIMQARDLRKGNGCPEPGYAGAQAMDAQDLGMRAGRQWKPKSRSDIAYA
ncbi:uncharacterized protein THITE_117292 [Thermothielavioides terrestris NRRL 8126]|uniref:Uncharacterized protein n=1 Tax=Thermothielavioides terrestris (strain ATCC 38088 / NRRL 8126) TaxID=578455 RepID=G2R6J1_THETT|nr:uncharacterized protein THITE_117292 [Thermothielavioides terrestris NRRL 8126]AEO68472.1 hypothetical protein THITE_117292 [Thermothielavioides terrestris NRRL 8126]